MNCSICKEKIEGFGNNAQPINDGRCCDTCNKLVIIERIMEMSDDQTFRQLYLLYMNKGDVK